MGRISQPAAMIATPRISQTRDAPSHADMCELQLEAGFLNAAESNVVFVTSILVETRQPTTGGSVGSP